MLQDTINDAIKQHEGLIFYTLQYLKCGYYPEYLSAGYEALWRAVETFDNSAGVEFSTYAVTCIKNAIYTVFRQQKEVMEHEVYIEDLIENYVIDDKEEPIVEHPEIRYAVDEALKHFTGTKLSILKSWLEGSKSATAIAKEVGCSQSYVSQVLKELQVFLRKETINAGYCPRVDEDRECF